MIIREMMKEFYKLYKEDDLKKINKDTMLKLDRIN